MKKIKFSNLTSAPLDVPRKQRNKFLNNLSLLTKNTGRLFILAGDQRVEHLNNDFYGPDIVNEDAQPEHLFKIASSARIGALATQMGYIARFGATYPKVPYLVKLNSKTNLVPTSQQDPYSPAWVDIRQVVNFSKDSGLNILGVGYTIYLGSNFETSMLREAAQIISEAHKYGLVVLLWAYPRGQAVKDEKASHLIAGAVNVASALGADFVKVNQPEPITNDGLMEIISAGQRTGVIFAGGSATSAADLLNRFYLYTHRFGAAGAALGRNLHQHNLTDAVALANAMASIIYDGQAPEVARRLVNK